VGAVLHGMRLLSHQAAASSVYNMFLMLQVGFRVLCASALQQVVR
jgi:hypothetical protein